MAVKYLDMAATEELVKQIKTLIESSSGGGHVAQSTAPDDTSVLWIDTSSGRVLKYYDSTSKSWLACSAVWG